MTGLNEVIYYLQYFLTLICNYVTLQETSVTRPVRNKIVLRIILVILSL